MQQSTCIPCLCLRCAACVVCRANWVSPALHPCFPLWAHGLRACASVQVFLTPTHLGIATEYVHGGMLFDRLASEGRFKEGVARFFFQQLVCGLAWMHSQVGGPCCVQCWACRRWWAGVMRGRRCASDAVVCALDLSSPGGQFASSQQDGPQRATLPYHRPHRHSAFTLWPKPSSCSCRLSLPPRPR